MYVPPAFRLDDPAARLAVMCAHPFALLVTAGGDGIAATPIPVLVDPDEGPHGTLYGHLARPNPQTAHLAAGTEAVVWFNGPHAYVSPRWYAARSENVPTWNYVAVEARGRPHLLDDATTDAIVARLSDAYEPDPDGWRLDEYEPRRRTAMVRGIVGFAMPIDAVAGKAKLSQNKTPDDRAGVIAALRAGTDPDGHAIATMMSAD
jgi:transcriptional regulator